jgi:hypothetical protein
MPEQELRMRCMEAAVALLASQDPELAIRQSQLERVAQRILEWVVRLPSTELPPQ